MPTLLARSPKPIPGWGTILRKFDGAGFSPAGTSPAVNPQRLSVQSATAPCSRHPVHGHPFVLPVLFYAERVKILSIVPLAWVLVISSWAQNPSSLIPQFTEFPAGEVFSAKPASPKFVHSGDQRFRTRIRDGASRGPNFAGHYTIADWGCGTSCVSIAVVDARSEIGRASCRERV